MFSVTIARWVSESMRLFTIVKDRGLRWLCKTGRPHFYLPDRTTVAKDVKFLYGWSERQLAQELQVIVSITYLLINLNSSDRLTVAYWPTNSIVGHPQTIVPL